MGETGCGKTRLIRFMCNLAAQGYKYSDQNIKNMLIMKVYWYTCTSSTQILKIFRYMVVLLNRMSLMQ